MADGPDASGAQAGTGSRAAQGEEDPSGAQRTTPEEPGGCRGPGGRGETVPADDAGVVTGRAPVRTGGHDTDTGSADGEGPVPPSGWRRRLPRRPWRWLGGLAALAALGSLALGAAYVWLTRVPGRGPAAGGGSPSGGSPSAGAPAGGTPSGAPPHTPAGGGTPWPTDGPHGDDSSPSGGSCSVQGVSCSPLDSACNDACNDMTGGCTDADACNTPNGGCGDPGCNGTGSSCGSTGSDCGSTLHTLWAPIATLGTPPYLHRTAAPAAPRYLHRATARASHAVPAAPLPTTGGTAGTPRVTVAARVGIAAIRAYQRISPSLPTRCRYTPTCSRYGLAAIRRYGLLTGAQVAVARIHRCTADVTPGTADPLPA